MATSTARSSRELDLQHLWHGNLQHEGGVTCMVWRDCGVSMSATARPVAFGRTA